MTTKNEDAIKTAGTALANIAYNLAQKHYLLAPDVCQSLDECRKAWDAALADWTRQREAGAVARPANCRNQLRADGQPYPKSGCAVCETGGMTGCPYERSPAHPAADKVREVPDGWITLGVGDGDGQLFVHGPYEAIKECQRKLLAPNRAAIVDREALIEAAKSLRTIANGAGKHEGLDDMMNVRGYANSRATVAEAALSPPANGENDRG